MYKIFYHIQIYRMKEHRFVFKLIDLSSKPGRCEVYCVSVHCAHDVFRAWHEKPLPEHEHAEFIANHLKWEEKLLTKVKELIGLDPTVMRDYHLVSECCEKKGKKIYLGGEGRKVYWKECLEQKYIKGEPSTQWKANWTVVDQMTHVKKHYEFLLTSKINEEISLQEKCTFSYEHKQATSSTIARNQYGGRRHRSPRQAGGHDEDSIVETENEARRTQTQRQRQLGGHWGNDEELRSHSDATRSQARSTSGKGALTENDERYMKYKQSFLNDPTKGNFS